MGRKLRPDEVDRLLREALRADFSGEQQGRLRGGLREAWAEARVAGVQIEAPAVAGRGAPSPAFAGAGGRLLAAAALAALALGAGLHLALPRQAVADSLSRQQAAARVLQQLPNVLAMVCVLDLLDEQGRPRRYRIEWRAPYQSRVRVEGAEGVSVVAGVVPRLRVGLLGAEPAVGDDTGLAPVLRAARDFLAPDRVSALLEGRWEAEPGPPGGGTATVFGVSERGGPGVLRVTIDPLTGLPVRLEDGVRATFEWERGAAPARPLAGVAAAERQ